MSELLTALLNHVSLKTKVIPSSCPLSSSSRRGQRSKHKARCFATQCIVLLMVTVWSAMAIHCWHVCSLLQPRCLLWTQICPIKYTRQIRAYFRTYASLAALRCLASTMQAKSSFYVTKPTSSVAVLQAQTAFCLWILLTRPFRVWWTRVMIWN